MENRYLVITSRYVFSNLTKEQCERKVACLKELNLKYEVFEEFVIKKVVYKKVNI